jgi:hypothetical protein
MINKLVKISFNPQNPMHLNFWLKTNNNNNNNLIVAINNFVYIMQFRVFVNAHFPFSFLLIYACVKNKWCSTINLLLLETTFSLLSNWRCAIHFENDEAIHQSDSFWTRARMIWHLKWWLHGWNGDFNQLDLAFSVPNCLHSL